MKFLPTWFDAFPMPFGHRSLADINNNRGDSIPLAANITIEPIPPADEIILEGIVVDMSYTGIKIKLNKPLRGDIPVSDILIKLTLPESGVQVSIHGIIKHLNTGSECGLQYSEKEERLRIVSSC